MSELRDGERDEDKRKPPRAGFSVGPAQGTFCRAGACAATGHPLLRLQSIHGNAWVSRQVETGRFADAGARPSRQVSRPPVAQRQHGPSVVQRLNTGEDYYFTKLQANKSSQAFRKTPEMSSFLGNLRQYTMLTNNAASLRGLGNLTQRIGILNGSALKLPDAAERVSSQAALGGIEELIHTALDDISQERAALGQLATDNSLDTSGMTFQQALFATRAGVPLADVLNQQSLATGAGTNPAGNPERLGGGQVSEVTALDYNAPQTRTGRQRRVFKPNEVKPGTVAGRLDKDNVQTAYRVLAASRLEQLIQNYMQGAKQVYTKPGRPG